MTFCFEAGHSSGVAAHRWVDPGLMLRWNFPFTFFLFTLLLDVLGQSFEVHQIRILLYFPFGAGDLPVGQLEHLFALCHELCKLLVIAL